VKILSENKKEELEREVQQRTAELQQEKKKSDDLLLNILPTEVAEEIKKLGRSQAKTYSLVSVMFTDFKDFTAVSEKVSGELLVAEIDHCFSAFDHIIQKHNIEKIKTVGDAYLCAGGLPVLTFTHATDIVEAAIEIREFMLQRKKEKEARAETPFEIRIGIHTGAVVAGIVGVKKFAYDIWGDTVNVASRMEEHGEAGKINISGATYQLVKDKFSCVHRGKMEVKNKGDIDMYFVEPMNAV
jgi:class 3 adenylate cyclase